MTNIALEELLKQKHPSEPKITLTKVGNNTKLIKEDNYCEILAGAFILKKYEQEEMTESLTRELDQCLFKPVDRARFGLQPRG